MKAALLPDRGVVKVAGDDARKFLNGLVTADIGKVTPEQSGFGALLTPQGKIIVDFLLAEAGAADGGGFISTARGRWQRRWSSAWASTSYALRSTSRTFPSARRAGDLGELRPGSPDPALPRERERVVCVASLCYRDPRVTELGLRCMLPPHLAADAAANVGAQLLEASSYEAHRIALGIPRGGLDFIYSDAFPHETDMDQLGGVDFDKGCFVGQEVVSRIEHRGTARTRVVPVSYDGFAPEAGTPISAGSRTVGTLGSTAQGRGLAMLRLDRAADALAAGEPLVAGGIEMRLIKPDWAQFAFPGDAKVAE